MQGLRAALQFEAGLALVLVASHGVRAQQFAPGTNPGLHSTAGTNERAVAAGARPIDPRHPLKPVLDIAYRSLADARAVKDYSCVFVKREEIDGRLQDFEYMFMKVRNEPFSVYLYCLGPGQPRGQEAIYVDGQNDGKALAHAVGVQHKLVGTVSLQPTGKYMMQGNLYPITNAGMVKLLEKTIQIYEREAAFGECDVRFIDNAKVDNRVCLCVQVSHPVPRKDFVAHLMRTYFDKETNLPIRWEAYSWPKQPGEQPVLVEEYTYRDLKLNQGFTNLDFDPKNPAYGFN